MSPHLRGEIPGRASGAVPARPEKPLPRPLNREKTDGAGPSAYTVSGQVITASMTGPRKMGGFHVARCTPRAVHQPGNA